MSYDPDTQQWSGQPQVVPQHAPLWMIHDSSIDRASQFAENADDFRQSLTNPENCTEPAPVMAWQMGPGCMPLPIVAGNGITTAVAVYAPTPEAAVEQAVQIFLARGGKPA